MCILGLRVRSERVCSRVVIARRDGVEMPSGGEAALAAMPAVGLIAVVMLRDAQELLKDVDEVGGGGVRQRGHQQGNEDGAVLH